LTEETKERRGDSVTADMPGSAGTEKPAATGSGRVKKFLRLFELFLITLRISAVTLGGGYAIVAVMKREFVDKRGWLDEREMLDYTAISQSTIGPIAINAALLAGRRIAGWQGAAVAVLGSLLPPLVVMTVIAYTYSFFTESGLIHAALLGMQAATAAVIADAAISLASSVWRDGRLFAAVLVTVTFALTVFTPINSAIVILGAGAAGIIRAAVPAKGSK
jgi:chromate transporter